MIKETVGGRPILTPPHEHNVRSSESQKHPWWQHITKPAVQMVIAAVLAVATGIAVAATVDEVPDAARALLVVPGELWLRGLKCIGKHCALMVARRPPTVLRTWLI